MIGITHNDEENRNGFFFKLDQQKLRAGIAAVEAHIRATKQFCSGTRHNTIDTRNACNEFISDENDADVIAAIVAIDMAGVFASFSQSIKNAENHLANAKSRLK